MDQEIPDYDMDSEDEKWMDEQVKKMEITPLKFEEMLDRLEKGSGQQVNWNNLDSLSTQFGLWRLNEKYTHGSTLTFV